MHALSVVKNAQCFLRRLLYTKSQNKKKHRRVSHLVNERGAYTRTIADYILPQNIYHYLFFLDSHVQFFFSRIYRVSVFPSSDKPVHSFVSPAKTQNKIIFFFSSHFQLLFHSIFSRSLFCFIFKR